MGALAVLGFGGAGAWVLGWVLTTGQTSLAARSWPTVTGTVHVSGVRGDGEPDVRYAYTVDGATYHGARLGFDTFDRPGGRGTRASRSARYPVGRAVTVYVDPADPRRAVLEPGDLSPLGVPALFGVLFTCLGGYFLVRLAREATGRGPVVLSPAARARVVGGGTAAVLAAAMVLVSLESGPQEVQSALLGGARPFGLPPWAVFLGLGAFGFAPVPWGLVHLARLNEARAAAGWPPVGGALGLLLALQPAAPGGRSKPVVAGVLLWCLAQLLGFIAWTAAAGV